MTAAAVASASGASVVLVPAAAEAARDYLIAPYKGGDPVAEFATEGADGRSADETAIGNLLDWSQHHDGEFVVYFVPGHDRGNVALCAAQAGVGRYLVTQDSASADSMHGTQLSAEEREHWRTQSAIRRGLEPHPWDEVA